MHHIRLAIWARKDGARWPGVTSLRQPTDTVHQWATEMEVFPHRQLWAIIIRHRPDEVRRRLTTVMLTGAKIATIPTIHSK